MENKVCSKCNEEKDICNFNKDKKRKDGLKNFCKTCSNIQRNEWVKNNKEKNDATRKEYNEKNKDRIKLVKQKYSNRIDVIDRTNANREKNKDKINDRRRELRKIKNELNKIEEVFLKEGEKQCTKCKEIKLSSEFSKNKHSKDGYYSNCKDCKKRFGVSKILSTDGAENENQIYDILRLESIDPTGKYHISKPYLFGILCSYFYF
jgi:hypothetical protein